MAEGSTGFIDDCFVLQGITSSFLHSDYRSFCIRPVLYLPFRPMLYLSFRPVSVTRKQFADTGTHVDDSGHVCDHNIDVGFDVDTRHP
ncbi:hypothetical protein Hanom_Chr04g00352511 [Helianthus anomalus]